MMEKTYNLLRTDRPTHRTSGNKAVTRFLIVIILLSVLIVILDSFDMPGWYRRLSLVFDIFTTAVFSFEYLLRMLRIFRLFVFFKFNRYSRTLSTIGYVIRDKRRELLTSMAVVFSLMLLSSALIYPIEGTAQPDKFPNILSGLWWAVSTLLTIGYGDIYPVTVAGKILSAVVAILGVGLIAVPTGIISAGFIEELDKRKREREERKLAQEERKAEQTAALHPADAIAKYKALLDGGAITAAEYAAKKKELLGRPG